MGGEEAREGGTELKGSRGCSRPDVWPRRTCVCVCVCARARVQGDSLYDARLGGGAAYKEQRLESQLRSVKRL